MRARTSAVVLVVTALSAVAGWLTFSAHSADAQAHRAASLSCIAINPFHVVVIDGASKTGRGGGDSRCTGSCSGSCPTMFNYTVRLYNDAGDKLAEVINVDNVGAQVSEATGWTGCAGAYVRGFIFVNYDGSASSNTELISNHTYCG
jgi:hypothetical protein